MRLRFVSSRALCLLVALPAAAFAAAGPQNLMRNAGFEKTSGKQVSNWSAPAYWSGEILPIVDRDQAHGGRRYAQLKAAEKSGKHWGRILYSPAQKITAGQRYRFSLWVKGEGEFKLGCIHYTRRQKGKPHYRYVWQEKMTPLTHAWQRVELEISTLDFEVLRFVLCIEVQGKDAVIYLDDAVLIPYQRPGFSFKVTPAHVMLIPGTAVDISIRVSEKENPITAGTLKIIKAAAKGKVEAADFPIDKSGVTLYRFEVAADAAMGLRRFMVVHPDSGIGVNVSADVVDQATYETFAAAAAKVKLKPLPARLLFIGDSLSDQQRGYNYVDKLGFWLQQRYGEKVIWRNAGVGGDFITRIWRRMKGDKRAHRAYMYDQLFKPKPTHVFIFLGHNDTKVSSRSNYQTPVVTPEVQDKTYRLVIEKIRRQGGAKIILISASSSVYEICKANADKQAAAGKAHNLFGKPEPMEAFNAVLKKLAAELGCDYLDVYETTRTHPDKRGLFNPRDGVHLSAQGNRFIALEILKHLASK